MYKDIDMKGLEATLLLLRTLVITVIIFKMLAGDIVCCMHNTRKYYCLCSFRGDSIKMKVMVLFLVLLLVDGIASVCMSINGTTQGLSVYQRVCCVISNFGRSIGV